MSTEVPTALDRRWQPGAVICCASGRVYEAIMPENHCRNYGVAQGLLRRREPRRNYGCGDGLMDDGLFVAAGYRSSGEVSDRPFSRAERGGIRWLSAQAVAASQLLPMGVGSWLGR